MKARVSCQWFFPEGPVFEGPVLLQLHLPFVVLQGRPVLGLVSSGCDHHHLRDLVRHGGLLPAAPLVGAGARRGGWHLPGAEAAGWMAEARRTASRTRAARCARPEGARSGDLKRTFWADIRKNRRKWV